MSQKSDSFGSLLNGNATSEEPVHSRVIALEERERKLALALEQFERGWRAYTDALDKELEPALIIHWDLEKGQKG